MAYFCATGRIYTFSSHQWTEKASRACHMMLQHPWARKTSNMSHLKTRNIQKIIKKLLNLTKSNKYINQLKPL